MKKILTVIVALLIIGGGYYLYLNSQKPETVIPVQTVSTTKSSYVGSDFSFNVPSGWYAFDHPNSVTLLKVKEYPKIESESYALGDQIYVGRQELIGQYGKAISPKELLDSASASSPEASDGYEGNPTLVKNEQINGIDMLRIEHANAGYQQSVQYYVVRGQNVYRLYLYPYSDKTSKDVQNYKDFMTIVSAIRFIN